MQPNPSRHIDTHLPERGFIRISLASKVAGVAESTLWKWTREGRFPATVKLSPKATAFRVEEVREWLKDPQAWQAANKRAGL